MLNLLKYFRYNFFSEVIRRYHLGSESINLVILTHILPDRLEMFEILSSVFHINKIIAIPYSINIETYECLKKRYDIITPSLQELTDKSYMKTLLQSFIEKDTRTIIHEIGGYFAPVLEELKVELADKVIGIVESTEAGHRRYEEEMCYPFPVISVARGILKELEYPMVGASCVFSVEKLARQAGITISNKTALVIGYGRIGKGIAKTLKARGCKVYVFDIDPVRNIMAISDGFSYIDKDEGVALADIILGASGKCVLGQSQFHKIKTGALLASCSSKDLEFDLNYLFNNYEKNILTNNFEKFTFRRKYFYLLGKGLPINFIDDAIVGPVLALIQAEVIYSILTLANETLPKSLIENTKAEQQQLARIWLRHYDKIKYQETTPTGMQHASFEL